MVTWALRNWRQEKQPPTRPERCAVRDRPSAVNPGGPAALGHGIGAWGGDNRQGDARAEGQVRQAAGQILRPAPRPGHHTIMAGVGRASEDPPEAHAGFMLPPPTLPVESLGTFPGAKGGFSRFLLDFA